MLLGLAVIVNKTSYSLTAPPKQGKINWAWLAEYLPPYLTVDGDGSLIFFIVLAERTLLLQERGERARGQ